MQIQVISGALFKISKNTKFNRELTEFEKVKKITPNCSLIRQYLTVKKEHPYDKAREKIINTIRATIRIIWNTTFIRISTFN